MFWFFYNLFALVDGLCDALLYGLLGAESFTWNEHRPLMTRRILAVLAAVGAGCDAALTYGGDPVGRFPIWLIWLIWEVFAAALSFSLFHNEAYNFGRVWIKEQTLSKAWAAFQFNYQSPSTTARWDFDGPVRWVMAGLAVVLLGLGFVLLT